jgi:hypothetical protein
MMTLNPLKAGLNAYRNAIIVFLFAVTLFSLLFVVIGQKAFWGIWNVPAMTPHFADLRTITGGAESYSQGLDPMVQNPGDPWGRTMNYPRIWQFLFYLGIDQGDTTAFGMVLIFLFLVGVVLVLPNAAASTIMLVLAAALSPATLLGIERGNIDLLIFFLVAFSIFLAKTHLVSFFTLLAAFFLKLYPVFGFLIFLRSSKVLAIKYSGFLVLILLLYAYFYHSDLALISAGTPRSTSLSYGVNVFWMQVARSDSTMGWVARVGSYVIVLAAIFVSFKALLKNNRIYLDAIHTSIYLDAFRAGAGIYIGTFLLGNNWDYRLMFFILAIPQLAAWSNTDESVVKFISRLTLVSIFLSLWYLVWKKMIGFMPYGGISSYLIDELANWVAFSGLIYLLFASMPSWVSEIAQNTMNQVRR